MFVVADMIKVMRKQSNESILLFFCNGLDHNSMIRTEKEETSTCAKRLLGSSDTINVFLGIQSLRHLFRSKMVI